VHTLQRQFQNVYLDPSGQFIQLPLA